MFRFRDEEMLEEKASLSSPESRLYCNRKLNLSHRKMQKFTTGVVIANSAMFIAWQSRNNEIIQQLYSYATINHDSIIVKRQSMNGFTYAFSHAHPAHFTANMGILLFFGSALEKRMGSMHMAKTAIISIPLGFLSLFMMNMGG
jgi:membrane associated rhomboid family serine protease